MARKYDLAAAIRNAAERDGKLTRGLEAEVSQEIATQTGKSPRGFFVPWGVESRTLGFESGSNYSGLAAAAAVTQDKVIDVLRAKLALERLGSKILNLTPDQKAGLALRIPMKITSANVSWVDDATGASSQSNATIGTTTLVPHTVTAFTDVTRRMIVAGIPSLQQRVIEDLMTGLSVGIDAAAINGSGQAFTPLGLFQNSNITQTLPASDSGNGGAPAYADLVALEKLVGVAGGDSPADARVGVVTSAAGRSILRRTPQLPSGTALPCWQAHTCRNPQNGELETIETCIGYAAVATTNAPTAITRGTGTGLTAIAMGNFGDLVVNLFTEFDVLVNQYRQSVDGTVRVSAFVDVDVAVLHSGSFAALVGVNPA